MKTCVAAAVLFCPFAAFAGPVIGVLPATRQGQLNLIDNTGATQFKQAILQAWPAAEFVPLPVVSQENMAGCNVVILAAGVAGQDAIVPLTLAEQGALRAYVDAGGGAVIFSDNDTFAGDAPAVNASLVGPFSVTASGTGAPWVQSTYVAGSPPPNPPTSPVLNGPFGTVTSYSVGWSGWYSNVGAGTVTARLNQNEQAALVEFPRGALASGSGRVALFSDSTMVFNGYFNASDRTVTLNAIDASLRRCGPADVGGQGGIAGPDMALNNNDFVVFVDMFFSHNPLADRGATGGIPGHDGAWDNNDFVVFIDQFFGGCG